MYLDVLRLGWGPPFYLAADDLLGILFRQQAIGLQGKKPDSSVKLKFDLIKGIEPLYSNRNKY